MVSIGDVNEIISSMHDFDDSDRESDDDEVRLDTRSRLLVFILKKVFWLETRV